jgi:uncharacterized protein
MATNLPTFDLRTTSGTDPGDILIIGTANPGLAGLTAIDYLIAHTHTEQIGHVRTHDLPDITPFTQGAPRYPMRLFSSADSDICVLISELSVPVWAGEPFADAVISWTEAHGIDELCVIHGVPFPHGPQEHIVFHVGMPAFRERRIGDSDIPPLAGGFFDGMAGELMTRALDGDVPPVGALVTPTHPPGPDLDSALRFLDALETLYDIAVDETELRERAEELRKYYQSLVDRMQTLDQGDSPRGHDHPEDRMYM